VILKGPVGGETGWVMDFGDITGEVEQVLAQLDHRDLNKVHANPTAENLAMWIAFQLVDDLPMLHAIEIRETETSGVRYEV
jgi:6-pyruvoyltetrahydropterin/6-carboxytetrahydropterin synthase